MNKILIIATLALGACSTMTPTQQANLNNALNVTAKGLVIASQVYQNIGEPGLPQKDKATYAALSSAAVQLQSQVGSVINPIVINTGNPAVNTAIVNSINPGAIVTQATVNTVNNAAAIVAP